MKLNTLSEAETTSSAWYLPPYYEGEEDAYIQQSTKMIVNVGGEPGAWMEPVGLDCEIVPCANPMTAGPGMYSRAKCCSRENLWPVQKSKLNS
nr:DUF4198 domain-containing protein [uncultured Desulfobacter sp.]